MTQQRNPSEELKLELAGMKRNPYLVNYQEERKAEEHRKQQHGRKKQENVHQIVKPVPKDRRRTNAKRRARIRRKKRMILLAGAVCIFAFLALFVIQILDSISEEEAISRNEAQSTDVLGERHEQEMVQGISITDYVQHPTWKEDFLTPNEYSRPGDALGEVKNIFVHYTANQGTSASQNRSYFEQLKDTHERSASAHFIIGYEGEIIQCVPLDEIAYAVQTRNEDSISIECCYLADDGSFTQETYDSLITLLQWLVETYDLETEDILRHYDCGGKKCPIYYTEHEDAWEKLKEDVRTY